MLRLLEAKLIKTIVGTWNNVIYIIHGKITQFSTTLTQNVPTVVLFDVIISNLEERICALS